MKDLRTLVALHQLREWAKHVRAAIAEGEISADYLRSDRERRVGTIVSRAVRRRYPVPADFSTAINERGDKHVAFELWDAVCEEVPDATRREVWTSLVMFCGLQMKGTLQEYAIENNIVFEWNDVFSPGSDIEARVFEELLDGASPEEGERTLRVVMREVTKGE